MATAAWPAMPAKICRSFSVKALVAIIESRCMIPSSSSWWSSGTVIVERMPCMMIECAAEKRLSMVASDDSTAALLVTTSFRIDFDRTICSFLPSRVLAILGDGTPSSISRITPRSAGISSNAFMMIFSSSSSRLTSRPIDRPSSWARRSFS